MAEKIVSEKSQIAERPKRSTRSSVSSRKSASKEIELASQIVDTNLLELRDREAKWKIEVAEREIVAKESRLPEHSKADDFKDAYVIDIDFLTRVAQDVAAVVKEQPSWIIRFVGDQTLSGGDIVGMLSQSVTQNREIESITASVRRYDKVPLCNISFVIGASRSAKLDVSARNELVFDRLRAIFRETLPAQRQNRWWWIYNNIASAVLSISAAFLMVILFLSINNYLHFQTDATAALSNIFFMAGLFGIFPVRSFLFRRVEFDIGFSKKRLGHRVWLRKIALWPFGVAASWTFINLIWGPLFK